MLLKLSLQKLTKCTLNPASLYLKLGFLKFQFFRLLTKYYSNYNYTEEDAAEYVSHPINTYVLLKRTSLVRTSSPSLVSHPSYSSPYA